MLFRFFDKRKHVAHTEYARSHSVRVERFQAIQLFAGADELYGLAGNVFYRKRGAAAGVAVHFGKDDAGDIQQVVKAFRHVYGVLARHRVDDKQYFGRIDGAFYTAKLFHKLFVDVQSAGRVDNNNIVAVFYGVFNSEFGGFNRIRGAAFEHRNAYLLAHDLQLFYGRGAVDIAGDEQRIAPLLAEHPRQFGGVGGFTRALKTAHKDNCGRFGRNVYFLVGAAH